MKTIHHYWNSWRTWISSVLVGVFLGCFYRLLLSDNKFLSDYDMAPWIISIGFLIILPFFMGYLSVRWYLCGKEKSIIRFYQWFFLPFASILVSLAISLLFKLEGFICVLFAAPIMFFFAMIGGLAARFCWELLNKRSPGTLSIIALPLLAMFIEAQLPAPYEYRSVNTEIMIHAPLNIVWKNIKSVSAIEPTELSNTWVNQIGFPKPVAATLSHDGIGGIRQASFTGGLLFTETVNKWQPEHDLRFSIHANTETIPKTTLDEHVTIGGKFFDVLDGEYTLEQRADGVLLHLSSHERLSTHINLYASLWTDTVMRTIQEQILNVIRNRCENEASSNLQKP